MELGGQIAARADPGDATIAHGEGTVINVAIFGSACACRDMHVGDKKIAVAHGSGKQSLDRLAIADQDRLLVRVMSFPNHPATGHHDIAHHAPPRAEDGGVHHIA